MSDLNIVKLGEVCTIEKGTTGIQKAIPGKYPLVTTSEERKTHNAFQFDAEAVIVPIVSSTGHGHASLKRIHYQSGKFALGSILCAIIPKDKSKLSAEYLYRYLDLNKEAELVSRMRGMANVTLPISEISKIEIPLPPLGEQKKIAARIEKKLAMIDEVARLHSESQAITDRLLSAVLHEIFSNFESRGWNAKKFTDVLDVQGGSQPPKATFSATPREGYIRLYQIRDLGGKDNPVYVKKDKVSKFMEDDDILIGRYGASLGKIFRGKKGAYNVALAKVVLDPNLFIKDFVYYFLLSDLFQKPITSLTRAAQGGFNKTDLSRIRIPLPSLVEQNKIVEELDALFEKILSLRSLQSFQSINLKSLKQTISYEVFFRKTENV